MSDLNTILKKLKGMSYYNPLREVLANYGKLALNEVSLPVDEKMKINQELETYTTKKQFVDEFSIACIRRFFSQEEMMYLTIPYMQYLEERLNMMEFYRESGDSLLPEKSYVYEEAFPQLMSDIENSSEDAWWTLTWIEEYLIIAKKMDLINFEKDDFVKIFFDIKKKVLQLENDTSVKLNMNLMNAFEEATLHPSNVKALKCQILEKFLMGENLGKEMKSLKTNSVVQNNLDVQLELMEYADSLTSPINVYKYLALYKEDHNWLLAFPEELIFEIRKLISDIFHQPDSGTLASGLVEYLIIKDLSEDNVPCPAEIAKKCYPFPVEEDEVVSKIESIKQMMIAEVENDA